MAKPARGKISQQGIQSIEVGAEILHVLTEATAPVPLKDLAARAGMSASKAHKYLVSMSRCGLTRQDPVSGYYDLGALALRMGLSALNRRDAIRQVTEAAIEFNQRHDKTVMVTIWASGGPIVIALHNSSHLVAGNVTIGSVLPVLRSASGRLFLAYLPSNMTKGIVAREIKALQRSGMGQTFTPEAIEKMVERVKKFRAGWTKDDLVIGLNAIAAPIFDHQGGIVASLTILDNTEAVDLNSAKSLLPDLLRVTDGISHRLGFSAGDKVLVDRIKASKTH